jgi:hypothetical protein
MPSRRVVTPWGVIAALVGVAAVTAVVAGTTSSGSSTAPPSYRYGGPVATASGGGGGVLVYPSIVNVRLERAEAALTRAAALVDQGKASSAVPGLKAAQANMTAAWTAEKYVIKTTPPPVVGGRPHANASGGAPAGPSFASPQDTALAVFTLQSDVVTTAVSLLGGGANLDIALTTVINAAVSNRDAAVAYIHAIPAPPPPPDRNEANASGGAVASGWDTTMPSVIPLLDDEIQAIVGTRKTTPSLAAGDQALLKSTAAKDRKTENDINTYWPPVVGDD